MFSTRFVFHSSDHPNLIALRSAFILTAFLFNFNSFAIVTAGPDMEPLFVLHKQDTVFIQKGRYILSKNSSIIIPRDTFYVVHKNHRNRSKAGSYQNSRVFYDTVYKKFSRNKITQLLYYLAFAAPKQSELPDSSQVLESNSPFEKFKGKVIRSISIKILSPFGTSVYDTGKLALTGLGKALNGVHINSKKYMVTRNLLFKKGERITPSVLADNERILRDLSAIDDARIIVSQQERGNDSVDLIIVTKDVWSIGIDVPVVTLETARFRIYDGNFLGLGDKFIANMSIDRSRAPFFMFDGFSYTYNNISGSLISASVGYSADPAGNSTLLFRADRSFLTNMTKWAGGAYVSGNSAVNEVTLNNKITSKYHNEGIWLGRAYLLRGQKKISRAVISLAGYRSEYISRPIITIDSNKIYYNNLQVLTTFSISRNNYYLTDYVLNFGKTENLPYGHLFQITLGAEQCDFYTRFYSGITVSAGNFFNKFGYLSAYLKFGGFFNHSSFEDAVVKFNLQYFTPLLKSRDKRYKFRTFYTAEYRRAFNTRANNQEDYNANLNFKIDKVNNSILFNGVNILSGKISSVCFTPLYFYGFRLATMLNLQSGLVAKKNEPLYNAHLFSSIGMSLIIKNDNLIFPAFVVSGYFYPSSVGNYPQFQFIVGSDLHVQTYDFNVTAPHEENLGN
jgi:hypothetical protein